MKARQLDKLLGLMSKVHLVRDDLDMTGNPGAEVWIVSKPGESSLHVYEAGTGRCLVCVGNHTKDLDRDFEPGS